MRKCHGLYTEIMLITNIRLKKLQTAYLHLRLLQLKHPRIDA